MNIDPQMRFDGLPLKVEYIDGSKWRVAEDIAYRIPFGRLAGKLSTVRRGFETDFASVPWLFRLWYPQAGRGGNPYGLAALWHDWLYAHHCIEGVPIERKEADQVFLDIMLYLDCSVRVAGKMYAAVRLFGWRAWM